MTSKLEYLIVHVLVVAGVLVISWGPLVLILRTVAMRQGVAA